MALREQAGSFGLVAELLAKSHCVVQAIMHSKRYQHGVSLLGEPFFDDRRHAIQCVVEDLRVLVRGGKHARVELEPEKHSHPLLRDRGTGVEVSESGMRGV